MTGLFFPPPPPSMMEEAVRVHESMCAPTCTDSKNSGAADCSRNCSLRTFFSARTVGRVAPLAGDFRCRCSCQLCGDELGCKTRLHPFYVIFRGARCEDCAGDHS